MWDDREVCLAFVKKEDDCKREVIKEKLVGLWAIGLILLGLSRWC